MAEALLDASGLKCPLPVLRARRALKVIASGATLTVITTDLAALGDFKAFCEQTGHRLERWSEADGTVRLVIRKA